MKNPPTPILDPLLDQIESAMAKYGLTATRFGYVVVGDASLVGRLRNGMILRDKRRAAVEAGLAKIHERGGAL